MPSGKKRCVEVSNPFGKNIGGSLTEFSYIYIPQIWAHHSSTQGFGKWKGHELLLIPHCDVSIVSLRRSSSYVLSPCTDLLHTEFTHILRASIAL